jgi:rifampicin phosphotransferase
MNNQTWDKTNIGENYPGITLPLTYSFIRSAYSKVYPEFLTILGFKEKTLKENDFIFSNMLGYIKGEVFYNIDNWYRLIKLLPGYSLNKGFFENMLDPVERDDSNIQHKKLPFRSKLLMIPLALKFVSNILFIKKHYKAFDVGYKSGFDYYKSLELGKLSNAQLVIELENIKRYFFSVWAHTIVNDFRVMVFFGLYSKSLAKQSSKDSDYIATHVYGINSKPESIVLLRNIIEIALLAQKVGITSLQAKAEIAKYLEKYGERSFNELKLEEHNFNDHPDQFMSIVKYYVQMPESVLKGFLRVPAEASQSQEDVGIYVRLLRTLAVTSIHKREEFRLKRAKVFNIANTFFKEMAKRLHNEGFLQVESDIYYLYQSEILDTLTNHTLSEDLKQRVSERKQIVIKNEKTILPRRVNTIGISRIVNEGEEIKDANELHKNRPVLKARITSTGDIVEGEIYAMSTLNFNADVKNKVLVTHATDPGWTILFPLLKGIIIEEGGMLSHASIVARELGIPCAILPQALKNLHTGDLITLDTKSGSIKLITNENPK